MNEGWTEYTGQELPEDSFADGMSAYTEVRIVSIAEVRRWRWPGPSVEKADYLRSRGLEADE